VKEDVLEQIVDDYLQLRGYFTTHNVRFSPAKTHQDYESRQDSVSSDVDVVGYHPARIGLDVKDHEISSGVITVFPHL
jgi:hypothetical protein